jgi:hypothetical protein
MKNLLPLFFLGITFTVRAQVNSVLPAEANTFYNTAMQSIKPDIKSMIEKNANKLKGRDVNTDSLCEELHKNELLKNINPHDLQALTVLIMVQVSKNADADLKKLVTSMHKKPTEKTGNQDSSESSISENKVERILANKSQIAENVSLVMKNLSGTTEMMLEQFK